METKKRNPKVGSGTYALNAVAKIGTEKSTLGLAPIGTIPWYRGDKIVVYNKGLLSALYVLIHKILRSFYADSNITLVLQRRNPDTERINNPPKATLLESGSRALSCAGNHIVFLS